MYTSIFRLVIPTHGRVADFKMTDFYRIWIGMVFRSYLLSFPVYCLIPVWIVVPHRQSVLPSSGMQEKTTILLVSDPRLCFKKLGCHNWNYMGLLWITVHVPLTENTLLISSQRKLSFIFDSWWLIPFPQHRSGLWSFEFSSFDQNEIFRDVFTLRSFGSYVRAVSWPYNANTVWSRRDSPVLRTISEGISLTGNGAWFHLTSKSWTSWFCKPIANRFESPCTASWTPVARKHSEIMYAICLPRKNRSELWARCSSTLALFR